MKEPAPISVRVGGLPRVTLLAALRQRGVQLNASATILLEDAVFDSTTAETIQVVERSVGDLGLTEGAVLSRLLAVAQDRGLLLCPVATGPYLRLSMADQKTAPDSLMSEGRAPTGSITVASKPVRDDDDYPKGFYLRVVDGVPWLRGFHCTDQYVWSPGDRFMFRRRPA